MRSIYSYLHRLIEPPVAGVALAAAAMDHLMRHVGLIASVRLVASDIGAAEAVCIERYGQRLVQAHQTQGRLNQLDVVRVLIEHQQLLAVLGPDAARFRGQHTDRCRLHRQTGGIAEQEQ